jgi:uncharacterized cupredoxin-like copper-binding protein
MIRRSLALGVVAFAAAACGSNATGDVDVTLSDMQIEMPSEVEAGRVTFAIRNDGPSVHEAEVFSVPDGVDATQLPLDQGVADTGSLELIDEAEEIAPSTNVTLSVELDPGEYVLLCNVVGHYVDGMSTPFTVS